MISLYGGQPWGEWVEGKRCKRTRILNFFKINLPNICWASSIWKQALNPLPSKSYILVEFFFLESEEDMQLGFWTQGFKLTTQTFYHLSHTYSPFCSGYFELGDLRLFAQAGLKSWPFCSQPPQAARIIGMSHQLQALVELFKVLVYMRQCTC
jgi:hypothetical protein